MKKYTKYKKKKMLMLMMRTTMILMMTENENVRTRRNEKFIPWQRYD